MKLVIKWGEWTLGGEGGVGVPGRGMSKCSASREGLPATPNKENPVSSRGHTRSEKDGNWHQHKSQLPVLSLKKYVPALVSCMQIYKIFLIIWDTKFAKAGLLIKGFATIFIYTELVTIQTTAKCTQEVWN